jgi:hypothetical protein
MLTPTGSLYTPADGRPGRGIALVPGVLTSVRILLALALGSIALGAALAALLVGHSSPIAPVVRAQPPAAAAFTSLPLAAQGPVSRALGADRAAYRVTASAGGFQARNPSQALSARFDPAGVSVRSSTVQVRLSLRGVGYGTSLTPLGEVTPSAKANRVSYARAMLREWYANGPLGLEQGFTILRASADHRPGPLTLSMALSGNARATLASDAQSVTFGHAGGSSLRYGGLRVSDARGRSLRGWFALSAGHVLLRVDVRGARYPLRIDPFVQQGEKLSGGGETGAGQFGFSVALSSDGTTALIGGSLDGTGVGAAWVFTRSGSTWTQQGGKLTGGGELGKAQFGSTVALSGDGNTALIGGSHDHGSIGAAWVFTRAGSTWTQQAKIIGSEEIGSGTFGSRVALSADGATALITGANDNSGVGAGWVFTRSGEAWSQQAKLTASGEIGQAKAGFGGALSGDGTTAILGGYADNSKVGAAWVFTRTGEAWSQQAELTASDEIGPAEFGESVAVSTDGSTALVGGEGDNSRTGAAWIFTRSAGEWSQQAKLTAVGQVGRAFFGNHSVALSGDGGTALVSGWGDDASRGAVWMFARSGESWSQQAKLTAASGEVGEGEFGLGLALSSDGSTALIGGPGDSSGVGAAWWFTRNRAPGVVTGSASSITQTSATLNATVNPEGETVSDCHFEYGPTPEYGTSVPCAELPGSGESPVTASAPVSGLSEDTTYHFRIVATNPTSTSFGGDSTFTTLPPPPDPPEFGRCVKLAKGVKGAFSTASCTTAATAEKFSFEWEPGPGPKVNFTTKSKELTTVTFETVTKRKVVCTGESGGGEYTGRKTVGSVTFDFVGCAMSGVKCSSLGAAEGEIRTSTLQGELGVVTTSPEGPAKNAIGLDLLPAAEAGPVMEFECGVTAVSVRGSVIASVSRNAMKLTTNLVYAQTAGKQKPEGFAGEPKDVLEASFGEAPFEQIGLKLTTIQTNEEKLEINSVV